MIYTAVCTVPPVTVKIKVGLNLEVYEFPDSTPVTISETAYELLNSNVKFVFTVTEDGNG